MPPEDPNIPISCVLVTSKITGSPAYVEIINFGAIAANGQVQIKIGKIKNPTAIRVDCDVAAFIFSRDIVKGIYDYIHYQVFRVFLDIVNNVQRPDYTNPVTLSFNPPTAKVDDQDVSIANTINFDVSL